MISRAAHAGQFFTLWIIMWVVLSWADVREWTETKNPAAGYEPVDGEKPMNRAI